MGMTLSHLLGTRTTSIDPSPNLFRKPNLTAFGLSLYAFGVKWLVAFVDFRSTDGSCPNPCEGPLTLGRRVPSLMLHVRAEGDGYGIGSFSVNR